MIVLAIETSTVVGSVALLDDDQPLVEERFVREGIDPLPSWSGDPSVNRSPGLFPAMQALLSSQHTSPEDIGLVAVGVGPGSFTGIRVGIATAQGLALPHGRPVKAVCSFDAVARAAAPETPSNCPQMCVLCDGRRGEIYHAVYSNRGVLRRECRLGVIEDLVSEVGSPIWFLSPEIERFRERLRQQLGGLASVCPEDRYPSAVAVGQLGRQRFLADQGRGDEQIEPIYLRTPEYRTL